MEKKKDKAPRDVNYLWLVAGGYLIYLSYDILKSTLHGEDGGGIWSTLAAIVFFGAGVWLCLRELQAYRRSKQEERQKELDSPSEGEP